MNKAQVISITYVAPRHVGLTHDSFPGFDPREWPGKIEYQGKTYTIHSYENPLVDASLFVTFYVSADEQWLGVDYEGAGFEDTTGPYEVVQGDLLQVKASDYGLTFDLEDLSWQEATITLDGGREKAKSVTYAPRSYRWLVRADSEESTLYSVFFQSESARYDDEIPDLEVLA